MRYLRSAKDKHERLIADAIHLDSKGHSLLVEALYHKVKEVEKNNGSMP